MANSSPNAFPHQLHMRIVRSPYAHAELRSVDVTAALAAPGVAAVWTGADIANLPPIDFRDPAGEALRPYRQPLLARHRLRYVGEPVLQSLEPTPISPRMPPTSFRSRSTNAAIARCCGGARQLRAGAFDRGDRAARRLRRSRWSFRRGAIVVELDLAIGRHSAVPLETRGALARYDAARDVLELHGAAKVPHRNRDALARMLGRSATAVVLKEGNTGGGFGVRGELYPEDFLVCLAALRLGRPVKWIEDRREHLMAANHSRQQHHRARVAVDADGIILGAGRRVLARPGRLRPHPRRPRSGNDDRDAARGRTAFPPIARSGISASPTRRRPPPTAPRAATRAPSCANG